MARQVNFSLEWNLTSKAEEVPDNALIYMILSGKIDEKKFVTDTYNILDIGQTGEGETRLSGHSRKDCWEKNKPKDHQFVYKYALMPSAKYNETDRLIVECCLRSHTTPLCGEECNNEYNREETVTITNTEKYLPLAQTYSCKKKEEKLDTAKVLENAYRTLARE